MRLMVRPSFFAVPVLIALAGCTAHSAPATRPVAAAASRTATPRYLRPDAIDVIALLPDPPAPGSAENELEYETLRRAVAMASDADKRRTHREVDMDVFVFDDPLGAWFTAKNCPHAARFFAQADVDA